jgi:hypothetical protein
MEKCCEWSFEMWYEFLSFEVYRNVIWHVLSWKFAAFFSFGTALVLEEQSPVYLT